MADSIYIKSGELGGRETMPQLEYDKEKGSEIAFRTDEKALYIGTEGGNVKVGDAGWEQRIKALEEQSDSTMKGYVDGLVAEINARLDAINARIDALHGE